MKKIIALALALLCILGFCGCNRKAYVASAVIESVPADYGKVVALAKGEFAEVFREFEDVEILETSTMARTDDAREIVIQFRYSSGSGDDVYGFLYSLEDYANPELLRQGEDVTIDALLGNP